MTGKLSLARKKAIGLRGVTISGAQPDRIGVQ
jgi:hypothetical protein